MKKRAKRVSLPADESKHDLGVEWWYFNGNLEDKRGDNYAFMKTLFRVDPKKARIPLIKGSQKEVYFSHSLICDIKNRKFFSKTHPVLILSKKSFPKDPLYASYTVPLSGKFKHKMEKVGKNAYHLTNEFLDLTLKAKGKPLLEEETGFIELNTEYQKTSYYYSLPNLEISGKIFVEGKKIEVTGQGWMDHQWSDSPFSFDKWNWFSIQLDDDTDLMCVEYGDKKKDYLASVMKPDGSTSNTRKVKLTPKKKSWKSLVTGASYPLEWKIEIPSEKIKLSAKALIPNAEIVFGVINYWEGPVAFSGKIKGKPVKGKGFMELVGRPAERSRIKIVEEELKKMISKRF